MSKRRPDRLLLAEPAWGSLRLMEDVVIESTTTEEMTVLTTTNVVAGRHMLLLTGREDGRHNVIGVEVVKFAPLMVDGVLKKRVQLRLFELGVVGELQVLFDEHPYSDIVRIVRVNRVTGNGSRCLAGAEFLPVVPPSPTSLRALVRKLAVSR